MTPLSLAYLVEISLLVNFVYLEIKYVKIKKLIDQARNDLELELDFITGISDKEVSMNSNSEVDSDEVSDAVNLLQNLSEGKDKAAWENRNWLRRYYYALISGTTHRIVKGFILCSILILCIITFTADMKIARPWGGDYDYYTRLFGWLWVAAYLFLVIVVFVPLVLLSLDHRCSIYLVGDGLKQTGRVRTFTKLCEEIKKRRILLLSDVAEKYTASSNP